MKVLSAFVTIQLVFLAIFPLCLPAAQRMVVGEMFTNTA